MTEQEIAGLSPAFAAYLGRYRDCVLQRRTMAHFDTYCRGLLSDLPRKSVEPIALESGTAVRTLQEFLVTTRWDQERARPRLQTDLAAAVAAIPADTLGSILPVLARLGAGAQTPTMRGSACLLEGEIRAARVHELQQDLPALTRGEGVLEAAFDHYRPIKGPFPTRPRTDNNPLDRKEYLQHIARRD